MRRVVVLVPVFGMGFATALPLLRYVEKQRHEEAAVEILQHVRQAQKTFRERWGGYATDINSLLSACGSMNATLGQTTLDRLRENGYQLSLRAAVGAAPAEAQDCRGRLLAGDYHVSAEPANTNEAGQQAFAARAEGDIHVFYDGLAPSEADIASGLSPPLSQRSTFRIP